MSTGALKDKISHTGVKQGDLITVALLLAISILLMVFTLSGKEQASWVRVSVDGEQVALLSLEKDAVYKIPGGMENVLEISGGRAKMTSAHCPDESCVRQGYISHAGECIVCLPARVTVTVVSSNGSEELDAVAY